MKVYVYQRDWMSAIEAVSTDKIELCYKAWDDFALRSEKIKLSRYLDVKLRMMLLLHLWKMAVWMIGKSQSGKFKRASALFLFGQFLCGCCSPAKELSFQIYLYCTNFQRRFCVKLPVDFFLKSCYTIDTVKEMRLIK